MFTENEIAIMIEIPAVEAATIALKEDFVKNEANFLDISDHDFLSLVMMTPTVGIALSNGSVSLFEELALNKMARKMSKGGFFMKIDPVAHAMKFLIDAFDKWELKFYDIINICLDETFDRSVLDNPENDKQNFAHSVMKVPYIFVRYISSFFLHDDADIVEDRSISKIEYEKVLDIGEKLKIDKYPIFKAFSKTFHVK